MSIDTPNRIDAARPWKATKTHCDRAAAQLQTLSKEKTQRQAEMPAAALTRSGKSLDDVLTFLRC